LFIKFILIVSLFFLSLILTWIIKSVAIKHRIVDVPNERSSHDIPTPRGGGLAVVASWFIAITILFFSDYIESSLYYALMTGVLLAIVSLIDDIFSLSPIIRLLAQTTAAIIAFNFLNGIAAVNISGLTIVSPYILYPVALIGIIWFINLFNFLDGIDGYASLEALTIAAIMMIFTSNLMNLVLIACVAGFLFWNWPKAKIFMGDIGSTQLGFILIILGIYFHNQSHFSIIHWIMLTSLFWFDATLTLFRRWKNSEKLSLAHKKHAYQRAVQSGLTHQQTILISEVVNLVIIGLIFVSKRFEYLLIPAIMLNIVLLYLITRFIDRKVPFITKNS
jgi:UDP-N-acetylmuramyl pentapeptide phosphotransferase/UDP-N-acetylglucosamine-1-phosphate transferase